MAVEYTGYVSYDEHGYAHVTTDYEEAAKYGTPMPLSSESMARADELLKYSADVVRHDQGTKDLDP